MQILIWNVLIRLVNRIDPIDWSIAVIWERLELVLTILSESFDFLKEFSSSDVSPAVSRTNQLTIWTVDIMNGLYEQD